MSAGVSDQRMKGQGNQVNNGPKEQLSEGGVVPAGSVSEDFESWRSQQQQQQQVQQQAAAAAAGGAGHGTPYPPSVPISSATDPYNMSTAAPGYYGSGGTFPYQAFGVGDGTWSNGTDPMPFLGGYTHDSYSMDGMFGPSTTFSTTAFGQPSAFNYFPGNGGDYSTWGTQLNQRKPHYDDYNNYRTDGTQNIYVNPQQQQQSLPPQQDPLIKSVEQNMQNLNIIDPQLAKGDGKDLLDLKEKKMTWASIASQPAKPQLNLQSNLKKKGPGMPPGPIIPGKHNMDIGTWEKQQPKIRTTWTQYIPTHIPPPIIVPPPVVVPPTPATAAAAAAVVVPPQENIIHPVLDELKVKNNYNPPDFDLNAPGARFFVIKSYSEDDIHRSIKYEIWCSTEHGNKRLDLAYREREKEPGGCVYLFFSVNGSGHFCGMAQMMSHVDYQSNSSVWSQDKWRGQFKVKWIYVKDVPNVQLRYIKLENNENKPVTNSRDTQEVPHVRGLQVLRILHTYKHSTSIFDDFIHYEKRQEEEDNRKVPDPVPNVPQQMQSPPPPNQQQMNNHREQQQQHHHHRDQQQQQQQHHVGGGRDNNQPRGNDRDMDQHNNSNNNNRRDHNRERRNHDHRDHQIQHDGTGTSGGGGGGNHRNQRIHDHHKERGDNNSRSRGRGGGGGGRNIN